VTSKRDAGAAVYNLGLCRQVEFVLKTLARLSERFDIEKDDALEEGTAARLEWLRERSRTFFQPEAMALLDGLHRIRSRVREGEGSGEVEEAAAAAEQIIRKELSGFVSAPHRLIRSREALHGSGEEPGREV
jgi:hypothetical protein